MRFLKFPALLTLITLALTVLSLAQNLQNVNPHEPSQPAQRAMPAHQRGDFDRGIYLGTAGNVCGAIVSYNFSPGENPQLQSITTCTPATRVTSRRARGIPPRPQTRRVFLMGVADQRSR